MVETHVVVTTKHRGIFFGRLVEESGTTVVLADARNCVYWNAETKGFLGLAANGPQSGCKVTAAAPSLKLFDVTSISQVNDDARKKWEAAPWA